MDSQSVSVDSAATACSSVQAAADKLVKRHSLAAAGLGLVPVPFLDLALIAGAQLNLVRRLAALYRVPFSEQIGKSAIALLVGGSLPVSSFSLLKFIPGIGTLIGGVSFPAVAGAATYAIGKVFIQHFESGGTFLNFDPQKVRQYYQQEFEQRQAAPPAETAADARAESTPEAVAEPASSPAEVPAETTSAPAAPAVAEPSSIIITSVRFLGHIKGSQSDEFVELRNISEQPVDVAGWRLRSEGPGQIFTFPAGTVIAPATSVRIYTALTTPQPNSFSFDSKRAIWNDKGDLAILSDASGKAVAMHGYGDKETRTIASITAAFGVPGLQVVYAEEELAAEKKHKGKVDFLTAVEDALRCLLEESGADTSPMAAATSQPTAWAGSPIDCSTRPLPERLRAYLNTQKLLLVPSPQGRSAPHDHWTFRLDPGLGDHHMILVSRSAADETHQKLS